MGIRIRVRIRVKGRIIIRVTVRVTVRITVRGRGRGRVRVSFVTGKDGHDNRARRLVYDSEGEGEG